jgi:hypothetical protein
MSKDWLQAADGSWHLIEHLNRCVICKQLYLLDDARDRGDGRVICDGCATKHNINYCRVCGAKINMFGGGKKRLRCKNCTNRLDKQQIEELRNLCVLKETLMDVKTRHIEIAKKLVMLGIIQRNEHAMND